MVSIHTVLIDCPLRKWLSLKQISGVEQTYTAETKEIFDYVRKFLSRASRVDPGLRATLQQKMRENDLDPSMTAFLAEYEHLTLDEVEVEICKDMTLNVYIGAVKKVKDGKESRVAAWITRSGSFRDMRIKAALLHAAAQKIYGTPIPDDVEIMLMSPFDNTIRIFPRTGKLTEKGVVDKRDPVGKWDTLPQEIANIQKNHTEFIAQYITSNIMPKPCFGECGTCPYHNVEITVESVKLQCVG